MSSEVNGLRRADRLMGSGALVLLITLFTAKWYQANIRLGSIGGLKVFSGSFNGWHAFTHSRWIWLATIIAALGAVFLTLRRRKLDVGMSVGAIVAGLGLLSAATIFYRIVHHPIAPTTEGTPQNVHATYSTGLGLGIWIALAAAIVITFGGYLAMRDERASTARERDPGEPSVEGPASRDVPVEELEADGFSGLIVKRAASKAVAKEPVTAAVAIAAPAKGQRPPDRTPPPEPPPAPSSPARSAPEPPAEPPPPETLAQQPSPSEQSGPGQPASAAPASAAPASTTAASTTPAPITPAPGQAASGAPSATPPLPPPDPEGAERLAQAPPAADVMPSTAAWRPVAAPGDASAASPPIPPPAAPPGASPPTPASDDQAPVQDDDR